MSLPLETLPPLVNPAAFPTEYAPAVRMLNAIPFDYSRYYKSTETAGILAKIAYEYEHNSYITAQFEPIELPLNEDEKADLRVFILEPKDESGCPPEDLKTVILAGNVHSNEPLWSLTVTFLADYFCKNPQTLRDLGLRIVMFDAEPGSNDNTNDAFFAGKPGINAILRYTHRSSVAPDEKFPLAEISPEVAMQGVALERPPGVRAGLALMQKYEASLVYWQTLHDAVLGTGDQMYGAGDYKELWPLMMLVRNELGLGSADQNEFAPDKAPNFVTDDGQRYRGIHQYPRLKEIAEDYNHPPYNTADLSIVYAAMRYSARGVIDEVPLFTCKFKELGGDALRAQRETVVQYLRGIARQTHTILQSAEPRLSGDPAYKSVSEMIRFTDEALELWGQNPDKVPNTSEGLIMQLFWRARILGSAIGLAEAAELNGLVQAGDEHLKEITQYIEASVDDLKTLAPRERVAMQLGPLVFSLVQLGRRQNSSTQ